MTNKRDSFAIKEKHKGGLFCLVFLKKKGRNVTVHMTLVTSLPHQPSFFLKASLVPKCPRSVMDVLQYVCTYLIPNFG